MIDDAAMLTKALETGAAVPGVRVVAGIRPHWIKPENYDIESAEDSDLQQPWRLRQSVTVFDPKSFVNYFTDYCNEDSRIFADTAAPTIVGVIDYHHPGDPPVAEWGEHRLTYSFRHTKEWKTWMEMNRKPFKQIEFARFIEDNLPDISSPAHAEMLQISRTMEAKKNVNFSSGVRLQNGEIQLIYQEEIRGSAAQGTLEIPEVFKVHIAPFEGSELYTLEARFRYSIQENALTLRYELVRPHKVVEDAVSKVVDSIRQGVTNPITYGVI